MNALRTICAWCFEAEKVNGHWGPLATLLPKPEDVTSHGICPACERAFRAAADLKLFEAQREPGLEGAQAPPSGARRPPLGAGEQLVQPPLAAEGYRGGARKGAAATALGNDVSLMW